jgi:hypothetical protein
LSREVRLAFLCHPPAADGEFFPVGGFSFPAFIRVSNSSDKKKTDPHHVLGVDR